MKSAFHHMRKSLILIATLFLAQISRASMFMSLSEAIRLAQEHSLEAKMARFSFLGSYWTYRSYRAELLPSVSLSGSLLNYDRSVTSVRNYDDGRINYVENNSLSNSLTLSVSQNIVPTGGTVSLQSYLYHLEQFNYDLRTFNTQPLRIVYDQPLRSYNALKWRGKSEPVTYEKAKRQYLTTMQGIAVMVTNLYFEVLSAQSDYQQALATSEERQRLYDQTKRRFELGTVSKSELLQLELSVINSQMSVKQRRLALDDARFQLFNYMQAVQWDGVELIAPDPVPDILLIEDEVTHRAMTASTYPLEQQLKLISSQSSLAQAKSQRGIQLSLRSEVGLRNTADRIGQAYSHLQDNEIVGLSVTWPIYDWGVSKGRVKVAKSNLEVVKTQIEQDESAYRQEVKRLVMQFNLQSEQCHDAARAEEIADERYMLMLQRFEAGSISVTDLNTAQQEKESARSQYINQLKTYWSDYYTIQRHTLWDYINKCEITTDFDKIIR